MKKLILIIGTAYLPLATSYGVLQCGMCKKEHKEFQCRKMLHMAVHLIDTHDFWLCPHCKKPIKSYDAYKEHVSKAHERQTCPKCPMRTFKDEAAYQLHADAVHPSYKWLCGVCRKRYPTPERFVIHAFVQHKQYVCLNCIQSSKSDEKNSEVLIHKVIDYQTGQEYQKHMFKEHNTFTCLQCNMRCFKTKKDYKEHYNDCKARCKAETFAEFCQGCGCMKKFRNKAEKRLHELQHAFLMYFLEKTVCTEECCTPFREAVVNARRSNAPKEWERAEIQAVQIFTRHVLEKHKRCLFCESRVTQGSKENLEKKLDENNDEEEMKYRQIGEDARMFIQLKENVLSVNTIPPIPCDMCGSALYPNRKSRLFFANIEEFPLGKGLEVVKDYPFHHLEYDERKVEKNTMMSVIEEVPANEEESCFIPKKDEKEDVILGEEDEAEDAEGEEEEKEAEEEDKKEEEKGNRQKDAKEPEGKSEG